MKPDSPLIRKSVNGKEVLIFKSIDRISDFMTGKWLEISKESIRVRGRFKAALSGGNTPVNLYRKMASLKGVFPWESTEIFLVDERFVPYEGSESNYRMIRHTLLDRIDIPDENIHSISTDEGTPALSASRYSDDISSFFSLSPGEFPAFDLILLGIGDDGHTASLFPGDEALKEKERIAVDVIPSDINKKERVSITLPVINNAEHIFFMVAGAEKANILKEVIKDNNSLLPAVMVSSDKGRVYFLVDEASASLITE
jgi:6-phosphogluconolactonase